MRVASEIPPGRVAKIAISATSREQDGERLDRYIKVKEFREENKILMTNLKTISDPNVRDYLHREQQRILEKRNRQSQSQSQPQSQSQSQSQQFSESYPNFFPNSAKSGNDLPDY
ncbi:hypothetical protein H5410_031240 [Solanum commersonii]|uniref:Uncharacterized protein n=1 Tax=Solanum commersonii TaxID=4109 RepID=A0A9J5YLQ0_SOLCO|nr:hypothetical protein H5410_031240 [Solanum commersonii]